MYVHHLKTVCGSSKRQLFGNHSPTILPLQMAAYMKLFSGQNNGQSLVNFHAFP